MQGGHVRMRGGKREKWALGSAQIIASISLSGRNGCDGGMGRGGEDPLLFSDPHRIIGIPVSPSLTDRPGRTEIKEKRARPFPARYIYIFEKKTQGNDGKGGETRVF